MRMPEPRSSRQLNQLATQLQDEAEISGVNASGTQISSRAFEMVTDFEPAGDQPQAIAKLVNGINAGMDEQLLLGVTGSGKTYTMAKVIAECQRPTIIMAHNKTLAAQLYGEFKAFFPNNAVEYFVSYYDYYQPEAYVAASDTFIEKDSAINDHIDQMRLSATRALLERRGVKSTTAALAVTLAHQAVVAAPAGLAASVTGAALAGGAAIGALATAGTATAGSTAAWINFMSITKLQIGIGSALASHYAAHGAILGLAARRAAVAQELARHSNIQITQRYAHLSDDELDKGYYEIFEGKETG